MDMKAVAEEIRMVITCRPENKHAVCRISEKMGLKKSTVYDYLYGKIKMSLPFIKASAEVTNDPDIKKFLEPSGMVLVKKPDLGEIGTNFHKEVNDVYVALAAFQVSVQEAIADNSVTSAELAKIKRARDDMRFQADEIVALAVAAHEKKIKIQAVG